MPRPILLVMLLYGNDAFGGASEMKQLVLYLCMIRGLTGYLNLDYAASILAGINFSHL